MKLYGLQILLPPSINQLLKEHALCAQSTWPEWGGHISVMNRFQICSELETFDKVCRELTCKLFPRKICLNQLVLADHLVIPDQKIVYLQPESYSMTASWDELKSEYHERLSPYLYDTMPEVSAAQCGVHVSMTKAVSHQNAKEIIARLLQSRISVEFQADQLTLFSIHKRARGEISVKKVSVYSNSL